MVRVIVKGSPYYAVKVGRVGTVIGHTRISTIYELVKVQFKDGAVWSFWPDELERLNGDPI